MNRLLIVGAGGFGREVLKWVHDISQSQIVDWEIGGFLDSNPNALDGFNVSLPILGDPWHFMPAFNDRFVCAIGNPSTKLRLCRHLKAQGAQFTTLIHPMAVIGPECTIGEGCFFCPGAIVTGYATLGAFVMLNVYATVGHDATIGDGCTLSGHTDVTGFARLGEGVFLGSHATVLPRAVVGDYAVVGAGSAVVRTARAQATVMGVPAKQITGFAS
jgi:sugar O-acyltransferase (sialic acid O-acetyltransferase NeuD family)